MSFSKHPDVIKQDVYSSIKRESEYWLSEYFLHYSSVRFELARAQLSKKLYYTDVVGDPIDTWVIHNYDNGFAESLCRLFPQLLGLDFSVVSMIRADYKRGGLCVVMHPGDKLKIPPMCANGCKSPPLHIFVSHGTNYGWLCANCTYAILMGCGRVKLKVDHFLKPLRINVPLVNLHGKYFKPFHGSARGVAPLKWLVCWSDPTIKLSRYHVLARLTVPLKVRFFQYGDYESIVNDHWLDACTKVDVRFKLFEVHKHARTVLYFTPITDIGFEFTVRFRQGGDKCFISREGVDR